ncbi:MAG: GNAT family N-acetyltransferase [Clostridia bacterium]|nr:GNAT family N-acetyltransferase [Clostridia bacterium]
MKVRNIEGKDICRIVDLWNETLPHEAIDKQQFVRKLLLDPNFSEKGFFIVEEGGSILGFINCPLNKDLPTGFISILAVCDKIRFTEVGDLLLNSAEKYFIENGKSNISTGYNFTQGVDTVLCPEYVDLYRAHGYTEKESFKRFRDLSKYVYPEKCKERKKALASEGIYVGELRDEYILPLINTEHPFTRPAWIAEFAKCLMDMDYGRIRIAAKDGEIVGCCVFGQPDGSPERFGPFGVNDAMQGKGIGTVLLNDCFYEMKKRGLQCVWSQWTPGQGAANALYERYGFEKRNSYYLFRKEL